MLGVLAATAPADRWLRAGPRTWAGALTTFSTFSCETVRLLEAGRPLAAVANVTASVVVSVVAAAAGWWLGPAEPDARRQRAAASRPLSSGLAGWWRVPSAARQRSTTSMSYGASSA